MKTLDCHSLSRISTFLDHVNVGDSVVCGRLEAYSCKLSGLDRQLSKSLDVDLQHETPRVELGTSPVGPLSEPSSRRTLVFLILTLNQCYPDYDFSQLRARHFQKEESPSSVEPVIDSHLLQVSKVWELNPTYGTTKFLDALWASIDEACDLAYCDVYSYRMADVENEEGPFSEQAAIWSFNYFFYNRRLKRIVYFSCRSLSTTAADREITPGTPCTPSVSADQTKKQTSGVEPGSDSEIVGGIEDIA